ncbi:TPA: membrane-bound PQQ-dependent dehydrogenase, glucose/quinate/shikimate family [Pseudomonas aeruginosa]|nr:membrane-bound PQQ-dependent dehydrogenase, glucose/quinate/shikimate family [Pseudomonas aeruginosa]HBP6821675.1 membrane-bound PQQ-dependent dehydrogenase, glucose/quinate/shikimate family [Pseudomonas aeruginosa]
MRTHRLLAVPLLLAALWLLGGGAWLWLLDGSAYYLCAGGALLVCAIALWHGRARALAAYATLLLGSCLWAWWEVGLRWWELVPRLALWFLLGGLLCLPALRRRLRGRHASRDAALLACALGLVALLASLALLRPSVELPAVSHGAAGPGATGAADGEWRFYAGDAGGQRYSPLRQIDRGNVRRLRLAWHYRSGDLPGPDDPLETTAENTPLMVGGRLYLCTPHSQVIALEAESGRELWRFDPQLRGRRADGFRSWPHMTCRGLAYHHGPASSGSCPRRLLLPTADARLIALDADSGKPCRGFGKDGTVDLARGLPDFQAGEYYSTSPPALAGDLVLVGGHVTDRIASGVLRAYDVEDGHLVWNWYGDDRVDGRPLAAGEQYPRGAPNVWSTISVDRRLGLAYLPVGNAKPDFWGGRRSAAAERYSSSVVALEIASGRPRWVFQATRHDIWDRDLAAQPTLFELRRGRQRIPALLAATKQGSLFVLDRRNGKPLWPVREVPAPAGAAEGDHTAASQPVSSLDFSPPPLRERDMWGVTPLDQLLCRLAYRRLRYEGPYTPPGESGSLIYPGSAGVFNWGGVALDPHRRIAFLNPSYMAFRVRLVAGAPGEPRYRADGVPFRSPLGLPCQAPPWGEVMALELDSGRLLWRRPSGTVRDATPLPLPFALGVPSLGGGLVTAGGLAFHAGTLDRYLRAYDLDTGEELWRARLPAGGQASPMSYRGRDGRQYLVIVAGGHGSLGTRAGDHVLAFVLAP